MENVPTFTTFRKPSNNFICVPINQYLKYTIQKLFWECTRMCYTDKDVNYPILYRDSGMEFNMYIQESQLMQLLEKICISISYSRRNRKKITESRISGTFRGRKLGTASKWCILSEKWWHDIICVCHRTALEWGKEAAYGSCSHGLSGIFH